MAFENEAQAAEALAAAVNAPEGATEAVVPAQSGLTLESVQTQQQPNQQDAPIATPDVTQDQEAPQFEEFTPSKDIDLSGLDDAQREYLQAREREMQAYFTQRTQEVSQREAEAQEAVQFINALNSDPEYALSVVQNLSAQLQAAGYSVGYADQAAAQQVQNMQAQGQPQQVQQDDMWDEDGFGEDPYLAEINALRQRQEQIDSMLAQQAEANRVAALEASLNNQAAYVQSQNPNLTDSDMAKIVNMAYSHGGDLVAAANEFKAIRDSAVQDWIARKGSVTAPAPLPAGGSAQAAPEKFNDLNDPRLEAAAMQRLNAVLGNS